MVVGRRRGGGIGRRERVQRSNINLSSDLKREMQVGDRWGP
jgi:hypothetical protein